MKKLTASLTVSLLALWVNVASASGIWEEEIYTWIIRWFIMQMGGQWN